MIVTRGLGRKSTSHINYSIWGLGRYEISGFPTQYFGLRAFYNNTVNDLCLVAEADAPTNALRLFKNGTKYAVYLVETNDGNASPIRIKLTSGVKAIRVKT
jgi:hypothetical protein